MTVKRCMFLIALLSLLAVQGFSTTPGYVGPSGYPYGNEANGSALMFEGYDSAGQSDIHWISMWFGDHLAGWPGTPGQYTKFCMLYYTPADNLVYLLEPADKQFKGGIAAGTNSDIKTTNCHLNPANVQVSRDTQYLNGVITPRIRITWAPFVYTNMVGTWHVGFQAQSNAGQDKTGYVENGIQYQNGETPNTPPPPPAPQQMGSVTGTHSVLLFPILDNAGVNDIQYVYFAVGPGSNGCYMFWQAAAPSALTLFAADGATPMTQVYGTQTTLQNPNCSIALASSYVSNIGNTKTLVTDLTAASGYAGTSQPLYMWAVGSGGTSGWVVTGNWTIPSMGTVESHLYTSIDSIPDLTIDGYTGVTRVGPNSDHPAPIVVLNSTELLPAWEPLTPYQVAIRFAAPNSQVWARETSIDEHQTVCPIYVPGQPTFTVPALGACKLVGMTDGNGYYLFSSSVLPFTGFRSIKFWVGDQIVNPNDPNQNTTGEADNTKAVGAVVFFTKGSNGQPPYSPYQ